MRLQTLWCCNYRYSPEGEFALRFYGSGAAPARPDTTRQPPLSSKFSPMQLIAARTFVCFCDHHSLRRSAAATCHAPREPEQEAL
ncbi:hypothetical protein NDU88_004801 [Pleurodeles waltl]|uniref:Uncharacterized protein n=1 Tax=Pleurodeles waltl TaxID=8319 RepID=A0AAV7MVL3_PLEWA|nr:hypothetical protein NDU88_004801 [Pleurodeles waltl]